MEPRDNRDSEDTGATEDTSHLSARVVTQKKSHKKLFILLGVLILVLVIVAAVGGWVWYSKMQGDKQSPSTTGTASLDTSKLKPEDKELQDMTNQLTDALNKQADIAKQQADQDAKKAIQDSTEAAQGVARSYDEKDLDSAQ